MNDAQTERRMIKAEDNPWYCLATLYGVPDDNDDGLQGRNRVTWNRIMVKRANGRENLTRFAKSGKRADGDFSPFTPVEWHALEDNFLRRSGGKNLDALLSLATEIDFSWTEFYRSFQASGFIFPSAASFYSASFSDDAVFNGAAFSGDANFRSVAFRGNAIFSSAAFSGHAHFQKASISRAANFSEATFSGNANFGYTSVFGNATFKRAAFSWFANFHDAAFSGPVSFFDATFSGYVDFERANFRREVFFVNADLRGRTTFARATFNGFPPAFFNAKLHEGTTWNRDRAAWPLPSTVSDADDFITAYERLKLEMDRLKKHEDEMDFFALELASRRIQRGKWSAYGIFVFLYGLTSDYGRGIHRPALGLLATLLIGTVFQLPYFGLSLYIKVPEASQAIHALALSFANTFSLFGFRKDLISAETINHLSHGAKVIAAVQTILGFVWFFLLGLAIRNHFRLK